MSYLALKLRYINKTQTESGVEKSLFPRGNSFQQAQEKVEKRGTFKASGITPYEPSELYNALDTIVTLEESIAKDASFFQAEICFIFSRIFVYKGTFILRRVRKSLIHYAAWFLRKKKICHH